MTQQETMGANLKIGLRENRTSYQPGKDLTGVASWSLDAAPEAVEVRLFWYTSGKGTRDVEVVGTVRFDRPVRDATQPFEFRLPGEPYSFSGKLVTLTWAVEVVVQPSGDSAMAEFVMAPGGRELRLGASA